jgi:hypothetical protein
MDAVLVPYTLENPVSINGIEFSWLRREVPLDEAAQLRHSIGMIRRTPGERLGLVGYGVTAGIGASVIGAWTSSSIVGGARIVVWIGSTTVFGVAAAWFAEPVVLLVGRLLRHGLGGPPVPR